MPAGQAEEITALVLVFAVHVVGALMLVWALLDADQRSGWRKLGRPPRGDDDGPPDAPPPGTGDGGVDPPRTPLPLAASAPSRVRLREAVPAPERYPRPGRRPAHPLQPREPVHRERRTPAPERRRGA